MKLSLNVARTNARGVIYDIIINVSLEDNTIL